MQVYKNDGSGDIHIYANNLHLKVYKGQVTIQDPAPPPANTRLVTSKVLSKAVRKKIRSIIEEYTL